MSTATMPYMHTYTTPYVTTSNGTYTNSSFWYYPQYTYTINQPFYNGTSTTQWYTNTYQYHYIDTNKYISTYQGCQNRHERRKQEAIKQSPKKETKFATTTEKIFWVKGAQYTKDMLKKLDSCILNEYLKSEDISESLFDDKV